MTITNFRSRTPRETILTSLRHAACAVVGVASLSALATPADGQVVISQLYGGGGGAVTTFFVYKDDFVELYNPTGSAVTMTNWSVQYAAATGSSWSVVTLNATIPARSYYLVKLSTSTGAGIGVSMAGIGDATGTIDMSATAGKVALLNNNTTLTISGPTVVGNGVVDFVGYGTTANWNMTAAAGGPNSTANNAPAPSATVALFRQCGGDTNAGNNAADFVYGLGSPRSSVSLANGGLSGIKWLKGIAEPFTTAIGNSVLLSVDAAVCSGLPSSGGLVMVDTSSIGGAGLEGMVDDGTNGDIRAGDRVYSLRKTIPSGVTVADKLLRVEWMDGQGRFMGGFIPMKVAAAGPANDTCSTAAAITPTIGGSVTVSGTTVGATPDPEAFEVPGVTSPQMSRSANAWFQNQENGVWYTIAGTGNRITLTNCQAPASGFDARIRVYCGSCAQFSYVTGNDTQTPACTVLASSANVSWCSAVGNTYYIYVSGATTTTGAFTLKVDDSGIACGQPPPCGGTVAMQGGDVLEGEDCAPPNINSGCDATCEFVACAPNLFTDISSNPTTVFGSIISTRPLITGGAAPVANVLQDRDWYRVTLATSSILNVDIQSEFPVLCQVVALSTGGVCPALASPNANAVLISVVGNPGEPLRVRALLPIGTYAVLIAGQVNTSGVTLFGIFNTIQCGRNTNYRAAISWADSGACCLPDFSCITTTATDCAAQSGTFTLGGSCAPSISYAVSSPPNALEDISTTGSPLKNLGDDTTTPLLRIGFPFYYFGESRSEVYMSSNGVVGFANVVTTSFTPAAFPNAAAPNDIICPLWKDLDMGSSSTPAAATNPAEMLWQRKGTAPNRRLILQWNKVPTRLAADANTFQVILYEGSNKIEFRYGLIAATTQASAAVGLENFNGTIGTNVNPATLGTGSTALLFSPTSTLCAPPANDTCATATVVNVASNAATVSGNSALAMDEGDDAPCFPSTDDHSVWWTFTTSSSQGGPWQIDTCGSGFDTVLTLYSGSCAFLSPIACNDDTTGTPCAAPRSAIFPTLAASTQYWVRVSSTSPGGPVTLRLFGPGAACATAIPVACGSMTAGTNVGFPTPVLPDCASVAPSVTNHGGNGAVTSPSVFYSIVGNGQTVTADTLTASFDTKISVYTGSCASPTCVTVNDDINTAFRSKVAFQTIVGQVYYIVVGGFGTATGTYTLNVQCDPTPMNDNCAAAIALGPSNGSISGTTVGATGAPFTPTSSTLASCATDSLDPLFDVWYSYQAPCNGSLTLDTCGAYDTLLSVHSACHTLTVGNQIAGACNDNGGLGCTPGSRLVLSVTQGTTYLIRVAGAVGANPGGNFMLTWSLPDSDGDGVFDACDGCPFDPNKIAPGVCGCGTPDIPVTYYADADGDGFGNPAVPLNTYTCLNPTPPAGYVSNNTDCDDTRSSVYPGAPELCDFLDNDCDTQIDEGPACNPFLTLNGPSSLTACLQPGQQFNVTVEMTNLNGFGAAGFQAFLHFDPVKFTFNGGVYTPAPFGLPIITPITATPMGDIDLASGIDQFNGQTPSSADAVLAILTFTTNSVDDCSIEPVVFRNHNRPARITNMGGQAIPNLNLVDDLPIVLDGTPPMISCPIDVTLECPANTNPSNTGTATANDNCTATPSIIITYNDLVTPGSCAANYQIKRTWKATDCSGNYSECDQYITVQDTTPPTFGEPCPRPTINVYADAGSCTASASTVNVTPPSANDPGGCSNPVNVVGTRSDNLLLSDPYPVGTTTITWTATDQCNNSSVCLQDVVVDPNNYVLVDVQLSPTVVASLSRCITFEFHNCSGGSYLTSQMVSFTNGLATGVAVLVPCSFGPYDCVTARDRLHTLRRTQALAISGTNYTANFTGPKSLTGGNLNDDQYIDILDFGVFTSQYNTALPPSNCSTAAPHSDIDGNGVVFTGDFTFIQQNFLIHRDLNCCGLPNSPGGLAEAGPVTRISVADLWARGLGQLTAGDLNGDGWLDELDIAALMNGAVPPALAVFNSGQDGSWFNPDRWGNHAVPNANTSVVIPESARAVIDHAGAVAKDVTIRTSGELFLANGGSLTAVTVIVKSGGTLTLNEGSLLAVNSLVLEAGAILMWNGGIIQIDGGSFTQADLNLMIGQTSALSTLRLLNGSATLIAQDTVIGVNAGNRGRVEVINSTFTCVNAMVGAGGEGTMWIADGGQVNCATGTVGVQPTSMGRVHVGAGSMWHAWQQVDIGSGGAGSLELDAGGRVVSPQIAVGQFGAIEGDGALEGQVTNSGRVQPQGALVIVGDFAQDAAGQLSMQLDSQRNVLFVNGAAKLGGTLHVTLAPTFVAQAGQVFDLVMATGGVRHAFDLVNVPQLGHGLQFSIKYGLDRVQLQVTAVFSPGAGTSGDTSGSH